MIMEQSNLKCIYEFIDCTRELDCTNCPVKTRYYQELRGDQNNTETNTITEQPILIIAQ